MANPEAAANLRPRPCETSEPSNLLEGLAGPGSERRSEGLEETLQRHGFVALPIGVDGTRLAVRHYDHNGAACCDVLAYQEVAGRGESLGEEAALLARSLRRIRRHLRRHPSQLSPVLRQRVFSFLGRKVHILCTPQGRPLLCRIQPLLILPPSNSNTQYEPHQLLNRIPAISADSMDQYLTSYYPPPSLTRSQLEEWISHLRRSHRLLGWAVLAFPLLLGVAGVMVSLGMLAAAMLTAVAAGLIPLLLLLFALAAFSDFKKQNVYTVLTGNTAFSELDFQSVVRRHPPVRYGTLNPAVATRSWNIEATTAFLLDAISSSAAASLSSYRSGNWRAFAGHLRAFLLGGLRLAYLKSTGQLPTGRLEVLLTELPLGEDGERLKIWLNRLARAQRDRPLTPAEAREASSFVFHLLRQLHALTPSCQDLGRRLESVGNTQVRLHPATPESPPPATANPMLPHTSQDPYHQTQPSQEGRPVRRGRAPSKDRPKSRAPSRTSLARQGMQAQPATRQRGNPAFSPGVQASDVEGATLIITSDRDHARLADMIRAGASPYLLIFADSYQPEWRVLKGLVKSAATALNGQANIILFPRMGAEKLQPTIREFFNQFRVEGSSSPPQLPFVVALSRQLLLGIVEDKLPVPNELVVEPHPEAFAERVRAAVEAAKTYQVDLNESVKEFEEDEGGEQAGGGSHPQQGRNGEDVSRGGGVARGAGTDHEEPPSESRGGAVNGSEEVITAETRGGDGSGGGVSSKQTPTTLVAEDEDVIEEVAEASSEATSRVVEVDLRAALEQRRLSRLVVIAQAVVRLPDDQAVLDALEAAAREEQHLVAQYVNLDSHPEACQVLQIKRGQIRIHYDGKERLVESPNPKHLLAILRQLRAVEHLLNHGESPIPFIPGPADNRQDPDSCAEEAGGAEGDGHSGRAR